jgi:hypothetical protein
VLPGGSGRRWSWPCRWRIEGLRAGEPSRCSGCSEHSSLTTGFAKEFAKAGSFCLHNLLRVVIGFKLCRDGFRRCFIF